MATFKFSGGIHYHDDTKLWKEIVNKENVLVEERLNTFNQTSHLPKNNTVIRPKTGQTRGKSLKNSIFDKHHKSFGNL